MTPKITPEVRAFLSAIGTKGGRRKSALKAEKARQNATRPRPNRRKKPTQEAA